jgi:hypothetical protein
MEICAAASKFVSASAKSEQPVSPVKPRRIAIRVQCDKLQVVARFTEHSPSILLSRILRATYASKFLVAHRPSIGLDKSQPRAYRARDDCPEIKSRMIDLEPSHEQK